MNMLRQSMLTGLLWATTIDFPGPGHTVLRLWQALSHGPDAGADVAALRAVFHPDARIIGSTYNEAGEPVLRLRTVEEFIAAMAAPDAAGFHECEVERQVHQLDRLAVVYSLVESRSDPRKEQPDVTGVNSLQLHNGPKGWQIVSLHYQLPAPGGQFSAPPDRIGQCLDR